MRIHTNELSYVDLHLAATSAGVTLEVADRRGSRKRDHAFEISLSGDSRRRPNFYGLRDWHGPDTYAATWDQWGVFLASLFRADDSVTCDAYKHEGDFHYKTDWRFDAAENGQLWPPDAHGDHTFRFDGVPFQQNCTKCSAVQRRN